MLQWLTQQVAGYEFFVSWRYLRSKRQETFISMISAISISGVALGVMALIIVLAVMTGLTNELRDKILGAHAHVLLFKRGGEVADYRGLMQQIGGMSDTMTLEALFARPFDVLESVTHGRTVTVQGVAPFIFRQVMIQAQSSSVEATVKGIDPQAEQTTSELAANIVQGKLDFLETSAADTPARPGIGILLGRQLAQKLGVTVGSSVSLISPMKDASSDWPAPKRQNFQVTGIFDYGMYEYDSNLLYISVLAAQTYFQTSDTVTGLEIKVDQIFASNRIAERLAHQLGSGYLVRDWADMNKNLFAVFGLYKKAMFLLLTLIVLVACLNIASTLIMMVMEKHYDIAILKSMGANAQEIQRVFVFQGVFIGTVGTSLGCLLGLVICWVADTYHLIRLEGGVYYLNYLPFRILPLDLALVLCSSLLICFFATLYPAKQAARLDPAVALRCD